jgi:hypothetical protein
MNTNAKLATLATVLLMASVWAYANSTSRGDRFQRGQLLLPNLILDEVATIRIVKADDVTTLQKRGEAFTVSEVHDYPTTNESVNRLLRDLLRIELEKEVGRGAELAAELEIDPPTDDTVEVTLMNSTAQEMVSVRIGASVPDGSGRYVQRLDVDDAPIYVTTDGVFLATGSSAFLKKEIVDHPPAEVRRVQGRDFEIAAEDPEGALRLQNVPAGRKEKSIETNRLKSILARLSFDAVFLADDAEVRDLRFDRELRVDLQDESSYVLSLATTDDRSFLRIRGAHGLDRVEIALDTPEAELQEKADQLSRADEIKEFNAFHASWVYELSSFTADKLKLTRADLLEDEA